MAATAILLKKLFVFIQNSISSQESNKNNEKKRS